MNMSLTESPPYLHQYVGYSAFKNEFWIFRRKRVTITYEAQEVLLYRVEQNSHTSSP
jgi:hypothetical protein